MVDHSDIPELDANGLRRFAFVTGAIVGALFGLFFPWLLARPLPLWPWIITAILTVWGFVAPRSLRPVYIGWMRFGLLLNRIMTPLILGIVYYMVITPTGMVMRLLKHDPMSRKLDERIETYRMESRKQPRENMEKPF